MPTSRSRSANGTAGRSPMSPGSTARAGSSSSPRCSAAPIRGRRRAARVDRNRARPSSPLPASCSIGPRHGGHDRGPRADRAEAAPVPVTSAPPPLERAIEDYLTYLRVERGLSAATIRAYRGDLADFAAGEGVAGSWAAGPDAARAHLGARTRRGRPGEPGLAPTSLRRRAASIRGFYRFAYGDGLIER